MEAEILRKKKLSTPKLRFKEFDNAWEVVKFDAYCDFSQGIQVDLELQIKEPKEGYIKFLRIENYTQDSSDFRYIPLELSRKNRITEDEIAVVRYGATAGFIGKGFDGVLANNLFKIVPNPKVFATNYLYEYLKSYRAFTFFQTAMSGGAMPALSFGIVKSLKVPKTTLAEQQKIASFLSAVNEKIQQLIRKKELLEQYKKGVMQQLFSGKLRFKDEKGKPFPKWEKKRLGEITALLKDGSHGTHKDYPEGNHFLLSAKNIINGSIRIDDTDRRISEEDFNSIYKNYKLEKNDVLLTIVGTIGRVAIYKSEQNIAFQRSVAFFRFKQQNADFLCQLMCGSKFQKELDLRKVISAQPGIYLGDLAKIPLKLPCLGEQEIIANYLLSIDNKIEIVNKQITLTQTFKKGLLQQMFV